MGQRPISVLVVDDSAVNRRAIVELLETDPEIQVVGRAADGEEALKLAIALRPDLITLDLEMPRMDGFTFLRILMAQAPTAVIVFSSYAHSSDVFKALELGAYDFVAKPSRSSPSMERIRQELLAKVHSVRQVRAPRRNTGETGVSSVGCAVIAVGASTGGPPAVQRFLESIAGQPVSVLVAQHMPAGFTKAFADRLDRIGSFAVKEGVDGDLPQPGTAFIAPGGRHLELAASEGSLQLRTTSSGDGEKHAPSVDRLFASVAYVLGSRSLGVVLTGMGADGAEGTRLIHRAGGRVFAESPETAVINGMPQEAVATGCVFQVLPLHALGPAVLDAVGRMR